MNDYQYAGYGTPLSSAQGQIIQLPMYSMEGTPPDQGMTTALARAYSTGLTVLFQSLTTEKYLTTETYFRLKLLADGTPFIYVNLGLDGGNSTLALVIAPADLAAAGITLTTTRPHFFYFQPVNLVSPPGGADSYEVRLFIDAIEVPCTRTLQGSRNEVYNQTPALGGTRTASFADFTVFEWFRHSGPGLTTAQQQAFVNGGRGANAQRLSWLGNRLINLVRFDAASYDDSNQWYNPLVGTGTLLLYSSAYKGEYTDTNRLFFDGLNDYVAPLDGTPRTQDTYQDFTYEVEVIPNKQIPLPGEGTGSPIGFDPAPAISTVLAGTTGGLAAYTGVPYLLVGTNGICFGVRYLSDYGNIASDILLTFAVNLSTTQMTKVGIRFQNRRPTLFLNGVNRYTGSATSPDTSPGSANGDWPVALQLTLGSRMLGYGAGYAGPWSGWLRNFRVWNYARSDSQMTASALPSGTETGLVVFWPLSRLDGATGTGLPTSTAIVDKTGQHPAQLVNYVLSPASAVFTYRVGRSIRP